MGDPIYKGFPKSTLKYTAQVYERRKTKALSTEDNNNEEKLDVIDSIPKGSVDLECLFKDPSYCVYKPQWSMILE